jgi:hypothetical protein
VTEPTDLAAHEFTLPRVVGGLGDPLLGLGRESGADRLTITLLAPRRCCASGTAGRWGRQLTLACRRCGMRHGIRSGLPTATADLMAVIDGFSLGTFRRAAAGEAP